MAFSFSTPAARQLTTCPPMARSSDQRTTAGTTPISHSAAPLARRAVPTLTHILVDVLGPDKRPVKRRRDHSEARSVGSVGVEEARSIDVS